MLWLCTTFTSESSFILLIFFYKNLTDPSLEKMPETGRWRFMNTSLKFEDEVCQY